MLDLVVSLWTYARKGFGGDGLSYPVYPIKLLKVEKKLQVSSRMQVAKGSLKY